MTAILLAIALLASAAIFAAAAARFEKTALAVSTAAGAAGCLLGGGASLRSLLAGARSTGRVPWALPVGEIHVGVDPLSAFFLLCIFAVALLAAVYGGSYLRGYLGRRRIAPALVFFQLLVASMALLVLARDGILFLVAWEILSLSSFFLVTFENDREDVRRAGITYLVASQLGVVFLFVVFALLSRGTGRYDFDVFAAAPATGGLSTAVFALSLVGFGTKAGFWPVHVWLPDAHPAAPSHVAALMSGVMIKMGIYGLLRVLTLVGPPPVWWGVVLLGLGAVSGIAGVLHALAQHDVKRLLAYHSVENIGIIALGIGLGLLGRARHEPGVAFLGFSGALLHVLNHGLFKGLLFQAAGSVAHATGTRELDAMGGLSRRMPWTASAFLLGSAAICALPPLNGFVSEWLIYAGAFRAGSRLPGAPAVSAIAAIAALALIGGLAAACFAKAFGVVFLGEPRTDAVSRAHEAGPGMRTAMVLGGAACVLLGIWPAKAAALVAPAASSLSGVVAAAAELEPLSRVARAAGAFLALTAGIAVLRRIRLSKRPIRFASTWGCGYAHPAPRMQYTAASFAEPLIEPFAAAMNVHVERDGPTGPFPRRARYEEHCGDMAGERFIVPAARRVVRGLGSIRVLQQGRVQSYLLYIAATLVGLLVWQLFANR